MILKMWNYILKRLKNNFITLIILFRFIIPKRQLRFVISCRLLRSFISKTSKDRQDKCLDDELRGDLPKDLFDQLDATKSDFVLDLDYQHFEKQCFLINKLLIWWTTQNDPKPSQTIRKQPKSLATTNKLPDISYNQLQFTRNTQQPAAKCIWLVLSSKISKLYAAIFPKLLKNN